jgi:GNAT superfamily N-acetyltransferase
MPQGEPTIREATAADAEALARVRVDFAASHAAMEPAIFRELDAAAAAEAYRSSPALTGGTTLVADLDGDVVGLAELRLDVPSGPTNIHRSVRYAVVEDLAVLDAHRRHGIATRLMAAAEDWARAQDADAMLLNTHPANTGALALYRDVLGYVDAGVTLLKRLP